MTSLRRIRIIDSNTGNDVSAQYPISTDGNSVYVKDIDVANSDNGDFSGVITDYFDSLKTVNNDASATNPKVIKIWFKHSLQTSSIGFGCDDLSKSFSNIVIKALGSGDVVRAISDDFINDDEKRNSQTIDLEPTKLNGVVIEFHTADEVGLSNIVIYKSENVNARLQAVNEVTGVPEDINSFNGALNMTDGLVHRAMVNEYFTRDVGVDTTLAAEATANDTSISVVDSTGLSIGNLIKIGITAVQEVGIITITDVVGNIITLDRPIAETLPIGIVVKKVENDMASLVGTLVSPAIYELAPPPGITWQITRLLITMADNLVMDDGKFGGIPALTNGITGIVNTSAGRIANITNWKTNSDIMSDAFTVEYNDKAPAGEYGLRGEWSFEDAKVIAELDGDNSEYLRILIQDDITANTSFRIKAQGRVKNL